MENRQEAFKRRARELAPRALERIGAIATGERFAPQHAIAAGKALIEFAFGRAAQEKYDESAQSIARLDKLLGLLLAPEEGEDGGDEGAGDGEEESEGDG